MKTLWRDFRQDEAGQDLIEYSLLIAFVAFAATALFLGAGNSLEQIWVRSNTQLAQAAAQ